ncbi:SHOCT domain-containing protein [Lentilactobacillus sp. SPB1-3]|uniref:SHOCT domain-containing protein n=1 Tax=Lentilactobacillus terminaliae TaxID=3003483 RepID=A0ACD5DBV7_9LACO|nr:SHOCT domain-containing protein [Lentilactobacillus sp. SPB1-3]MCZ0977134.1 SHOCT domain-containing protein [Lentilactobacillus sp. SPB1-3]
MHVEVKIPEHVIIDVDDAKIVITRLGVRSFLNRGQNGEQVIPLSSVIGINFKRSKLIAGQINFVTAAGNQKTNGFGALPGFSNGAFNKANNVVFREIHNDEIEQIKNFVEDYLLNHNSENKLSDADELKKFKALLDDGTITQKEFNNKKKQILDM